MGLPREERAERRNKHVQLMKQWMDGEMKWEVTMKVAKAARAARASEINKQGIVAWGE